MNVLKNNNKPKHNISIKSNYTVLSDEFKLYLQNCHFTIIKDKLIYWMNYRKMWEKSLFKMLFSTFLLKWEWNMSIQNVFIKHNQINRSKKWIAATF